MNSSLHFTRAILRKPTSSMVEGITTANLGKPDFDLALKQHDAYAHALRTLGLEIHYLPEQEDFPDACFVEDIAVMTRAGAVITRPGAKSRRGEVAGLEDFLLGIGVNVIGKIEAPSTLEGGDVMMVGDTFYVGLSARTNRKGLWQFGQILAQHGLKTADIAQEEILHLKTGLSYLENNRLLTATLFDAHPMLQPFDRILVPDEEAYAANVIYVNGSVLIPAGFPQVASLIEKTGLPIITLDMSEFQKLDGGLSCLSLRW